MDFVQSVVPHASVVLCCGCRRCAPIFDAEQLLLFAIWGVLCLLLLHKTKSAVVGFSGKCRYCRYDLSGLPDAIELCPECGAAFDRKAQTKGRVLTLRWYRVRRMVIPCVFFALTLFQGKLLMYVPELSHRLAAGHSWQSAWTWTCWQLAPAVQYGWFLLPLSMSFAPIACLMRSRRNQAFVLGITLIVVLTLAAVVKPEIVRAWGSWR
jgi:hypothetical protein